ncbi:hypothetical protein ACIGC1_13840 [Peribacillus butanolivorans]
MESFQGSLYGKRGVIIYERFYHSSQLYGLAGNLVLGILQGLYVNFFY